MADDILATDTPVDANAANTSEPAPTVTVTDTVADALGKAKNLMSQVSDQSSALEAARAATLNANDAATKAQADLLAAQATENAAHEALKTSIKAVEAVLDSLC